MEGGRGLRGAQPGDERGDVADRAQGRGGHQQLLDVGGLLLLGQEGQQLQQVVDRALEGDGAEQRTGPRLRSALRPLGPRGALDVPDGPDVAVGGGRGDFG